MNAMLLHKVDGTMKDESITWVNLGNHYIYSLGSATCKQHTLLKIKGLKAVVFYNDAIEETFGLSQRTFE